MDFKIIFYDHQHNSNEFSLKLQNANKYQHGTYLSNDIATRVNTEAATETFAIKLLTMQ